MIQLPSLPFWKPALSLPVTDPFTSVALSFALALQLRQKQEQYDKALKQNLNRVQLEGLTLERERKLMEEAAIERQENARQQRELSTHVGLTFPPRYFFLDRV